MKPKLFYFTLYKKGENYGGPEEGGWYYDTLEPVITIRCKGKIKSSICKLQKENYNIKFNIFSVEPLSKIKRKDNKLFEMLLCETLTPDLFQIIPEIKFQENTHLFQHYE